MRTLTSIMALAMVLLCVSCNSVDLNEDLNNGITERTDIIINGDLYLEDFRQVLDDDLENDLITYQYYGEHSADFDFIIELLSGQILTIHLHDAQRPDPWENVNIPYNTYPGQDLEDKLYYTNISLSDKNGTCYYSTNSDISIPPGISLDVFRITHFNGREIHCKIRDMILYKSSNPDKTISINGTFHGAFTSVSE